jgi:hypothetical protein
MVLLRFNRLVPQVHGANTFEVAYAFGMNLDRFSMQLDNTILFVTFTFSEYLFVPFYLRSAPR